MKNQEDASDGLEEALSLLRSLITELVNKQHDANLLDLVFKLLRDDKK